ncbi:MAG TPA: DinB family protein [Chitinophagaceae bacterium]|nr:DinB family protein [Chitinophagaceae bacterium]
MFVLKTKTKNRRFKVQSSNLNTGSSGSTTMKELLLQMAAYNVWASQKLIDVVLSLPEEKQTAGVASSFTSLHKTILHMWDAESAWWQRMKLHERIIVPSENFNGSTRDVCNGLMQQSNQWLDWVNTANDLAIEHVFQYFNSKRESFKQPRYQMLLHVFNHGTYHRGQLVNMLRQLGVDKIPPTDFILWSRKKS